MRRPIAPLLLALVAAMACSDVGEITVPISDIIALSREETTPLRGDGLTRTIIRATVPAEIDPAKKVVTFRATAGSFIGGENLTVTAPADNEGHARVTYVVPASFGTVTITGKVSDYSQSLDLEILPANPDTLLIETSAIVAKRDGTAKPVITVLASRGTGKVSAGVPVTFTAQQTVNGVTRNVGRFSGVDGTKINDQSKATITFAADSGDVSAEAPVVIRASTVNDAGAPVTAELTLRIE